MILIYLILQMLKTSIQIMVHEKQELCLMAEQLQFDLEVPMGVRQSKSEVQMEEEWRLDMENRAINMKEEWVKLKQYNIPEGQFIVNNFTQDLEGTKIVLDDEKNTVEVFFDGIPVLVRSAVANIRMRTWSEVQLKYHDKLMFRNTFFFEVKNSKLVQWSNEEGCGFYEENQLRHYCIVTSEEVIDVLATFEPVVRVINFPE